MAKQKKVKAKRKKAKRKQTKRTTAGKRRSKKAKSSETAQAVNQPGDSKTFAGELTLRLLQSRILAPEADFERAVQAYRKYGEQIMQLDGVVGVDVGLRSKSDVHMPVFAIRVHVKHKAPQLADVPESQRIPLYYDGVPTDVIESKPVNLANAGLPASGAKIKIPGDPTRHGTLGVHVMRINPTTLQQEFLMLTAAHVIGGDNPNIQAGIRVDDENDNHIGDTLGVQGSDWQFNGLVDGALVEPLRPEFPPPGFHCDMPNIVGPGVVSASDISQQKTVKKCGGATGESIGRVTANIGNVHGLVDHLQIVSLNPDQPFATQGDSGALVTLGNRAVGLVRAVSEDNRVTFACQYVKVAAELDEFFLV